MIYLHTLLANVAKHFYKMLEKLQSFIGHE